MSGVQIVAAANRSWIAGMVWRSFQDAPRLGELREDAADLHAQWMAVRSTSRVVQTGFCSAIEGRKPRGLYSLAAAVAESQQQPWLGIYQLAEDVWWYIAVRDGQAVLPDGDVVGDLATVEGARARHQSIGYWNFVQGTLADLQPVLSAARERTALVPVRSVEPVSPLKVAIPALAICALAAGGAWWWHQRELADERARQAAMAAARARIEAAQKAVSPLLSTPAPAEWLAACAAVVDRVPVAVSGWRLVQLSCVGNGVRAVWKRGDGASVADRPRGVVANAGNSVTRNFPMPHLEAGPDDAHGLPAGDDALYALLQPLGVRVVISAPPRLPGSRRAGQPAPFPEQTVQFDLPVAPFYLGFGHVPGLRLASAEQDKHGWTVRGTLYGR